SNMAMMLRNVEHAEEEVAAARDPLLRFLTVPRCVATEPRQDIGGARWRRCTPGSAADFSALAYFAGRQLTRNLGIPIGLIHASVGATPAESWVPPEVLTANPLYAPILERYYECRDFGPGAAEHYASAFAKWDKEADLAEREGRKLPGPHPVY